MERLCQTYWYPLYVFVRRKGHNHEDASDLTQAYFARFLEKRFLKSTGMRHHFVTEIAHPFRPAGRRSEHARARVLPLPECIVTANQPRSKRSRFMTLFHTATKSRTNFS